MKKITKRFRRKLLSAVGLDRNLRKRLSLHYIRGTGLEVGALHTPLPVAEDVVVKYVDLRGREENIVMFPELNASEIVDTHHIDNGFVLSSIPEASQGFLIANHVLEHAPNPFQVMLQWSRILRPEGILFVTVPIAAKCFDKGRSITPVQHLIDDFELCRRSEIDQFRERNRDHYAEWLDISEPNILSGREDKYVKPSSADKQARSAIMLSESAEIHFHTFSLNSFAEFLSFFCSTIDQTMVAKKVAPHGSEVIGILQKRRR